MGDVIGLPRAQRAAPVTRAVRIYGTASGLGVVLVTDADAGTVSPLRLAVTGGAPAWVEDLAVFPNSDEGRSGADTVAVMVLRVLELAEIDPTPRGAA